MIEMTKACTHEVHISHIDTHSNKSKVCGEFCDVHHLFHLNAIMIVSNQLVSLHSDSLKPDAKHLGFHPLFDQKRLKPPKA